MAENPIDTPKVDRFSLEEKFGGYTPPALPPDLPNIPYRDQYLPMPSLGGDGGRASSLTDIENQLLSAPAGSGKLTGGSNRRSLAEVISPNGRFNNFMPGDYDNEDAYARGQGWGSKAVNSILKGTTILGTGFLQGTVGLANGVFRFAKDGRFASLYDNDFNRTLDDLNTSLEETYLPNYRTAQERNAKWYSPDYFLTANFLWNDVIKNLGYAGGAVLSGQVFAKALQSIPLTARLFSSGKAAEALAATEKSLLSANSAASTYGKLKALNDRFLSSYKLLNPGGRAVVAALATTGEAGLESLQNLNQYREKKIQEYMDEYGVFPTGEAMEKINSSADSVGNATFWGNAALLTATNYIQFPKILGSSYKAEKGILNQLSKEINPIAKDAAGKFIAKTATTRAGKILAGIDKVRPFLFSGTEAFEEGAQFAIQKGVEDYYNKKYKDDASASILGSVIKGAEETLMTDEGMKNVLIGGLSGAIMTAPSRFTEARERSVNTANALRDFNKKSFSDFTNETIDSINRGVVLQEEREQYIKDGNVIDAKDREADYVINYLTPRIKYGRYDLVRADIEDHRALAMTDEGFAQLQADGKVLEGDTREAYLQRLNGLEATANNVKNLYQSLTLRYGNLITKDGKPVYSNEVMDKMLYAASKVADYDKRIPQLTNELTSNGISSVSEDGVDVQSVIDDANKGNFEKYEKAMADIAAANLINKDDLIEGLHDVVRMSMRRQSFLKAYDDIKDNPLGYKEATPTETTLDENGNEVNTIKVKTRDGDKDFQVNVEYFAGSPIRKSKEGVDFPEFTRFTFLGRNEDGSLKIKQADGRAVNIPVKVFEKYKINTVTAVENRPNAKFYIESAGQIFTYQLGGGRKAIEGTIQYDMAKDQLKFVTLDGKRTYLVDRSRFVAKEGYVRAQIYSSGKLTKIAEDALKNPVTPEELMALYNQRDEIINQVIESNKTRLEEVNKDLEASKKELATVNESLTNLTTTKKGLPKKRLDKAVRKTVEQLAKTKERLDRTIKNLEAEKSDLEETLFYFEDIRQYKDELPEEYSEIFKDLQKDVNTLEDMIDNTNSALNESVSMLAKVESALSNAFSLLNDFIKRLQEENPNLPLAVASLQDKLEKYLGEEGARQFIADRLGFTQDVIDLEDQISEFREELAIPEMTSQVEKLKEDIVKLESQLEGLIGEQMAKVKMMEAFEAAAAEFQRRVEEEAFVQSNPDFVKEALGTEDNSVQTVEYSKSYEADSKKPTEVLPRATVNPARGKAHHARSDRFGANLGTMPNRDRIRGVYITANNEDKLIPGLVDHLRTNTAGEVDENIDRGQVIALVMVEEGKDGVVRLVDENGVPIESGEDLLNKAIYQVYPSAELKWGSEYDNQSMFREGVSDDIKNQIKSKYAAWRSKTLEQTGIGARHKVGASFGLFDYVKTAPDDKGKQSTDHSARTPIQDAGLVDALQLSEDALLRIPTTNNTTSQGLVSFNTPLGRVFLQFPNGLVKLNNRKLTKAEAQTIYQAIYRLSQNMFKDGNAKSEESKRLINWLKSIVYWGTPKDSQGKRKAAGYNSVFFEVDAETGKLMLTISGKGMDFEFTPTNIKDNEKEIRLLLENMYTNTNSTLATGNNYWNRPYEEILSISPDGTVESRMWKNYQTFLLSNTNPDGSKRKSDEVPLTTIIRPLESKDDVNRRGIYFYTTDNADDFAVTVTKPAATPSFLAPGVPTAAPAAAPVTTTAGFKLDGSEETISVIGGDGTNYGTTTFKLNAKEFIESGGKKGFSPTFEGAVVQALMDVKKVDVDKARSMMAATIMKQIKPEIDRIAAQLAGEQAPVAPAPTAPVSDIEAKKADIERRRQEEYKGNIVEEVKVYKITVRGKEYEIYEEKYDKNSDKYFLYVKRPNGEISSTSKQEEEIITTEGTGKTFLRDETSEWIDLEQKAIIDAEYDAELAALEGTKPAAAPKSEPVTETLNVPVSEADEAEMRRLMDEEDDDAAYRVVVVNEVTKFERENWNKIERWLKANFPNLPVYRVKNIIKATNGMEAWGMLKDGAIYIYENAEVGTIYHEVFEAVWKMFATRDEKVAVLNEFRNRKGTFVDRPTQETVKYSEATPEQIKEQLAEEFRDYVRSGKIPAKPGSGRPYIVKLFSDLVNFIKEFFVGPNAESNTEQLFKKIGSGYYKDYSPYPSKLAFAEKGFINIENAYGDSESEFSLTGITGAQKHEILQEMTYRTLRDMVKNDDDLFAITTKRFPKKELYERLNKAIQKTVLKARKEAEIAVTNGEITPEEAEAKINKSIALRQNIVSQWDEIVKAHEEYLRSYGVEFDENDQYTLRDEDKSGRSDWQDARKVDVFRKSNAAVRLLLSTMPVMKSNGDIARSSIGGVKLLPVSQTFISIMNNVNDSESVEEMVMSLREMAKDDINYQVLYSRLTKSDIEEEGVDLTKIDTTHGAQLLSAFWRTFKKQNPDVKNVFILDNGDVVVGDSNLSTAARQIKSEFQDEITIAVKGGTSYFKYDEKQRAYVGDKAAISSVKIDTDETKAKFLEKLGIVFDINEFNRLTDNQLTQWRDAVSGIKKSIENAEKIMSSSGKVLDIDGRLIELSIIKAVLDNPEFDSTYFNVNGERIQSYLGANPAYDLHNFLSKLDEFNERTVGGTQYSYLLTDSFAKGSNLLKRMFSERGKRVKGSKELLKSSYVDGTVNNRKGKKKESSQLTYKERLVQELNLNLKGYYLNLVPGDASIQWMMYMGNAVDADSLLSGYGVVNEIFKDYFLSELELSRENRPVVKGRNTKDLRFFKAILEDVSKATEKERNELHDNILKATGTPEEVYARFEKRINAALQNYINRKTQSFRSVLKRYGIIGVDEEGYYVEDIALPETSGMEEGTLNRQLNALTVNFMINNIELHKLLYSDPYQYSDELKRIKNFLSPRQSLISNSKQMKSLLNKVWNRGFTRNDIGYTDFTQDFFRTATVADVLSFDELPGYDKEAYKESDGGGIIGLKAYRNFRINAGDWTSENERQYKYEVAWEKRDKGLSLTKEDKLALENENPEVRSTFTTIKPIVAGNKGNGKSYNDVVLDKFALYPLTYRIMKQLDPNSNAIKLYNKMQEENIDYVVFESGRKVGSEFANPLYNQKGEFSTTPFEGIVNIPFAIMSVQTEVPSKEDDMVTRGSQITKLVTMDYMEAGVPVDFMEGAKFEKRYTAWVKLKDKSSYNDGKNLYNEIKKNQDLLENMMDLGYENLLDKLGIKVTDEGFKLDSRNKVAKTLREEIFKREANENIKDAIAGFENGDVILEATPAYQQIRNILYSIADKQIFSVKITGGMKVQLPSTLLESVRAEAKEVNGKQAYASNVLSFYKKDGKQVCEIMVSRWFDSPLSDEELLNYFNNTEEGKKELAALTGVAFRIPTQKQNSIDSFVIKKFLPREFGDNVIIPSALVNKAGSDFDIDKLSVYLKNVYVKDGKPKMIPYFGTGPQAIKKFEELFEKGEFLTDKEVKELDRFISEELDAAEEFVADESRTAKLTKTLMGVGKLFSVEEITKDFTSSIKIKDQIINKLYKKSLENEYMQSMQNLISHPKNFDRLIKPNSPKQLKDISEDVIKKLGYDAFDYSSVGNMMDRHFMSRLRHAFVTGKYAIGIAAVNQTNHSLNQRQLVYLDRSRLKNLSEEDRHFIGDAIVRFKDYNRINLNGETVATLSMIKNAERSKEFPEGQDISDIIAQFIDGYVDISKGPWIMELGASPNVASTFLFLAKIGVPIRTIAYFMNQPIIRDYLNTIENAGYSWLFIDSFADLVSESYEDTPMHPKEFEKLQSEFEIPSEKALGDMIGKGIGDLNKQQRLDQQLILKEFLKYAKMAEQMFLVTQGSNFDTATFNDPYLIFKKMEQLEKARKTIISSVDDILNNSFIGKMKDVLIDTRNAFAQVLMSDRSRVRGVMENVLRPYVNMRDNEFVKISQKAVADLFDWAVQNDRKLNLTIQNILLNNNGVAKEIRDFVNDVKKDEEHPLYNNHVINSLQAKPNDELVLNKPNNIKVKGKDNKVYDQNNLIYGFRELKQHLKATNPKLYGNMVRLAVLQSGLTNSPISFTTLLPYDDFKEIYNKTLSVLEKMPNLEDFYKLRVFERVNWNNDDVVPFKRASLIKSKKGTFYNLDMKIMPSKAKNAMFAGEIPQLVAFSINSREAQSDVIVYSWEKDIPVSEKKRMRKEGDYSYINKGLFQKVYDGFGNPVTYTSTSKEGKVYVKYVYKMINAWGDSLRAKEFYDVAKPSVIDNGFLKVAATLKTEIIGNTPVDFKTSGEVSDAKVATYFVEEAKQNAAPAERKIQPKEVPSVGLFDSSLPKVNIYAGTGENADLSNFAIRPFEDKTEWLGLTFKSVEGAFQAAKIQLSDMFDKNDNLTKAGDNLLDRLQEASGSEAKRLGRMVTGLNVKEWDRLSSGIMKGLLLESFKQNPEALARLLATGNAELTHTQDKGKWGKEFPRLLMEVRQELRKSAPKEIKPEGLPAIDDENQNGCA